MSIRSAAEFSLRSVEALLEEGYRVASGDSRQDARFNAAGGTIRLQIPEFRRLGFDFDAFFGGPADVAYICGTLGLSVAPLAVEIAAPEFHLKGLRWTDAFDRPDEPPFVEDFYLSPAFVAFRGQTYKALLYIPDPRTKPGHFQAPGKIEVVAASIPGLHYGDRLILSYAPEAIRLIAPA
jgi:hypothetical protein